MIFSLKLVLDEDNKYKNSLSDIHSFKKMLSEYKFNSYELKEYYDMMRKVIIIHQFMTFEVP